MPRLLRQWVSKKLRKAQMYNVSFFCLRSGNSVATFMSQNICHMLYELSSSQTWAMTGLSLVPDVGFILLVAWNKHAGVFLLLSLLAILDEMLVNHRFSPSPAVPFTPFKKKWDRVSCLKKQSNVASHHHVKKVVSDSLLPVDFAVSDWARLSAVASVISILEKNRIIYHPAGFVIISCAWFSSV